MRSSIFQIVSLLSVVVVSDAALGLRAAAESALQEEDFRLLSYGYGTEDDDMSMKMMTMGT